VAAFEGNYEKQSKCQILMFDREQDCSYMDPTKNSQLKINRHEWLRIHPSEKPEGEGDQHEESKGESQHWKIIRVVILRQFTTEINIEVDQVQTLLDLLTTDGRGLTMVWRVYIQRTSEVEFEYKLRKIAQYQIQKKSQVF